MYFSEDSMDMIWGMLEACRGLYHGPNHPEGDVHTHSLQCATIALREGTDIDLIVAALSHDVGKAVEMHGHEEHSVSMLDGLVSVKTLWLVENHMRVRTYLDGEMSRLSKCQYLSHHPWFAELIQLVRWDNMARRPGWKPVMDAGMFLDRLDKVVDSRWQE